MSPFMPYSSICCLRRQEDIRTKGYTSTRLSFNEYYCSLTSTCI
nr:MAG TPA: hypothetical protein [Crassvirales sp.]